jgi:hypothetical protein
MHFEWLHSYAISDEDPLTITPKVTNIAMLSGTTPPLQIQCVKIVIPLVKWEIFDLVEPCGNVTIPSDGITFHTAFGDFHVPDEKGLNLELEKFDKAFSLYSAYVVGTIFVLYYVCTFARKKSRVAFIQKFKDMSAGSLSEDSPEFKKVRARMTQAERDDDDKSKLDPKSEDFVCKGNIFRLLCVITPLEPGIGFGKWANYAVKAFICAYMQIFLPYNILAYVFQQWGFGGIKSPLWFASNGLNFLTMFAALGNVAVIFGSKCVAEINENAMAYYFLCSREKPHPDAEAARKPPPPLPSGPRPANKRSASANQMPGSSATQGLLESEKKQATTLLDEGGWKQRLVNRLETNPLFLRVFAWYEFVFCLIGLTVCIVSSTMLMLAMFLKIATFQGNVGNIAVVAVSLYFVFDLDNKIMESSPTLKMEYRREVLEQTVVLEKKPLWIKQAGSYAIGFVSHLGQLGLVMIVLISWQQKLPFGTVLIGGDPYIRN